MNVLTESLPRTVGIDGVEYPVNTDFRACLRVMLAFEDAQLTPHEKQAILLQNIYSEIPGNIVGAIEAANIFLNGGEVQENEHPGPRLYSFSKDANFIFAAFRQTHGIDLQREDLHWWEFLALFMDLGQDTTFCNLVAMRKRVKTGKATKEERQAALEMGDMFDIQEIDMELEEKELRQQFLINYEEAKRKRNEARSANNG